MTPFRNRQNSEVSTLHSESVWRERLFNLASTPNEKMTAANIELFRTFLSATRGIRDTSNIYDPDCRKVKGKDLDDLCLYFYADLQKALKAEGEQQYQPINHKSYDSYVDYYLNLIRIRALIQTTLSKPTTKFYTKPSCSLLLKKIRLTKLILLTTSL